MDAAEPKRRWFSPTPGKLVIGLLVVECLLWLSERFQWFRFNTYKGWTVLIVVACVGTFLLLMFLWFVVALLFRLRFQFSIRSLLLLMVAIAGAGGWFAVERERARVQAEVVDKIYKLGGSVGWNSQPVIWGSRPSVPKWLQSLMGDEFFRSDDCVVFNGCKITDDTLRLLRRLGQLDDLEVMDTTITDTGLESVRGFSRLSVLRLDGTQVTDEGLRYLTGMNELHELGLAHTKVTNEGVAKLQQALPDCQIYH